MTQSDRERLEGLREWRKTGIKTWQNWSTFFLLRLLEEVEAERDKLQAFKTWVHTYLDSHGVPHHPPGVHGVEGCRIGDRMDWLMKHRQLMIDTNTIICADLDNVEAERDRLLARVKELEKLAYIGEHHFPDATYKARQNECVHDLRAAEVERDRLRGLLGEADPLLVDALVGLVPETAAYAFDLHQRIAAELAEKPKGGIGDTCTRCGHQFHGMGRCFYEDTAKKCQCGW